MLHFFQDTKKPIIFLFLPCLPGSSGPNLDLSHRLLLNFLFPLTISPYPYSFLFIFNLCVPVYPHMCFYCHPSKSLMEAVECRFYITWLLLSQPQKGQHPCPAPSPSPQGHRLLAEASSFPTPSRDRVQGQELL